MKFATFAMVKAVKFSPPPFPKSHIILEQWNLLNILEPSKTFRNSLVNLGTRFSAAFDTHISALLPRSSKPNSMDERWRNTIPCNIDDAARVHYKDGHSTPPWLHIFIIWSTEIQKSGCRRGAKLAHFWWESHSNVLVVKARLKKLKLNGSIFLCRIEDLNTELQRVNDNFGRWKTCLDTSSSIQPWQCLYALLQVFQTG